MIDHLYTYTASNARCVDGDTLVCDVDLGFSITIRKAVIRLLRINTEEVKSKSILSIEAKNFVTNWLIDNPSFIVHSKKKDSFGRCLSEVYTLDGECLNDLLLSMGLAVLYRKT